MKALIIDDEKHVREAIRLLVPWDSFGIQALLEAQDGEAATELIMTERPEIIFTDMMMPNMDGTALLQWAAEHAPASKIIVISGFDDFKLVRHAVKYGGVDYILKPIDAEQLVGALRKAVDSWHAEEKVRSRSHSMNIELNQLKPLYLEQYFSKLIREPGTHSDYAQTMWQELGISSPKTTARIAVASLELVSTAVRDKFAERMDLLLFSLTNICNELLRVHGIGYALRHWGYEHEIVLLFWGEGERAPELLGQINDALGMALKTRLAFGLSEKAAFPEAAPHAYKQARLALMSFNLLEQVTFCHSYSPALSIMPSTHLLLSEHEERIRYAVQSGSKEHIRRALQPLFEALDHNGHLTLEQIRLWEQQFKLSLSLWTYQKEKSSGSVNEPTPVKNDGEPLSIPINSNGCFEYERWKEHVYESACQTAERIAGNEQERSVIQDIAAYIEQHPHEEITLQDISDRFFLSREYISRRFKQETNENLSDFIAKVRIKRAKELLGNHQLKISQIAELVGFQDEKYFSRVFKKWTNCSPNEYRKQHYGDET